MKKYLFYYITKAGIKNQNLMLFIRGKAMSAAPNIKALKNVIFYMVKTVFLNHGLKLDISLDQPWKEFTSKT
jgi:hypothetical protein